MAKRDRTVWVVVPGPLLASSRHGDVDELGVRFVHKYANVHAIDNAESTRAQLGAGPHLESGCDPGIWYPSGSLDGHILEIHQGAFVDVDTGNGVVEYVHANQFRRGAVADRDAPAVPGEVGVDP